MKTQSSTFNEVIPSEVGTMKLTGYYQLFMQWADRMDFYRLAILVATILIQGCIIAPATLWSMELSSNYGILAMGIVTLSSFTILVTNLSVQPMRINIPAFLICALVQIGLITSNLFSMI